MLVAKQTLALDVLEHKMAMESLKFDTQQVDRLFENGSTKMNSDTKFYILLRCFIVVASMLFYL